MTAIEEKETQDVPDNVIVAKNGAWIDKDTRKFVSGKHITTKIQDTSHAIALARKRWDAARDASEDGLARLSTDAGALAAWSDIVEARARNALENKGRAGTEDAKFVAAAADLMPDRRQNTDIFVQNAQIAIVPGELLSSIVADMGELRNQVEQIDGMVVDN